jgi:hypothetical protein
VTAPARLFWLAAAVPAIAACAAHEPPPPKPSPCGITECRPAKTLILQQQGKGQFLMNTPAWPYVLDGVVTVRPGDDFFITADDRDGALVNLRRIAAPAEHAPNVIHITYKQEQLNNGAFIMSLVLQSSFARPLVYHAAAMNAWRPYEPFSTSTCPVEPGIAMIETWPAPLWQLYLRNFRTAEQPGLCKVY